jgi:hypothetical protein
VTNITFYSASLENIHPVKGLSPDEFLIYAREQGFAGKGDVMIYDPVAPLPLDASATARKVYWDSMEKGVTARLDVPYEDLVRNVIRACHSMGLTLYEMPSISRATIRDVGLEQFVDFLDRL